MFIPEEEPRYPELTIEEIELEFDLISTHIRDTTDVLLDMDINPEHIAHELIMNGFYLLRASLHTDDYFDLIGMFYKMARKIPDFNTELPDE